MTKMTYADAELVRQSPPDFMDFWKSLNDELDREGFGGALYGDAHNMFTQWRPIPTPAEAAHHILRLRGER